MPLRVLVITEETRKDIGAIVQYASQREHWYNVRDRSEGWLDRLPGHNEKLVYKIRDGYRCVFGHSYDSEKHQLFRHLSVSVPSGGYPSPEAVLEIARLFGFTGDTVDDRLFPTSWGIHASEGGQIDDRRVMVVQPIDLPHEQTAAAL